MNSHGFSLEREERLHEAGGRVRLWKHDVTGAELLSVCNEDENKSYGVSIRTPPQGRLHKDGRAAARHTKHTQRHHNRSNQQRARKNMKCLYEYRVIQDRLQPRPAIRRKIQNKRSTAVSAQRFSDGRRNE